MASEQDEVQRLSRLVEGIAAGYAADSEEYQALEEMMKGYAFMHGHLELKAAYAKFVEHCDRPLGELEKERLRGMGIEPDNDPESTG